MRILLVISLFLMPGQIFAEENTDEGQQIVAEINGRKISTEEIDEIIQSELPSQARTVSENIKHSLRKQILNRIIEHELLENAARSSGYRQKEVSQLISQYLEEEVLFKAFVSEADIQAYYYSKPAEFTPPEEARLRHIFFKIPKESTAEETEEILNEAQRVQAIAAQSEEEFFDLAKKHSQGPRRANGGDLGFMTKNQLEETFREKVFSLKSGGVSEVLQNADGLHIFKVEERKASEIRSLELVREEVRNKLRELKRRELLRKHVNYLKAKNKIIVYID